MLIVNSSLITPADTKRLSRSGERYKRYGKQKDEICQLLSHCETICREIESHTENQRISMRIDLEVLNSVDFIITTSIMQSGDECDCECVKRYGRGAVFPTRLTGAEDDRD